MNLIGIPPVAPSDICFRQSTFWEREYHEKKGLQIAASLLIFSLPTSMATAGEKEDKNVETVMSETALKQEADYTAVSPAFGPEEGVQVRSAEGITSAPGGNGAHVGINVKGNGLHVDKAHVNYFNGSEIAGSNPTAEEFELTWYEGGSRRAETKGTSSGYLVASQTWNFNRSIDQGPMCGRVKISGNWSNYACVNIKP